MTVPDSSFTHNNSSNNKQDDSKAIKLKPKGVKKTYMDVTKVLLINDYNQSNLSIEDYCAQEDKPSAATMRKWLKANKPQCPECQSLKIEVVTLRAKLSVYERNANL
jgi:hypothetical protein